MRDVFGSFPPLNWISEYLYYCSSLRLGIMNVLMSDVTLSLETQAPKKQADFGNQPVINGYIVHYNTNSSNIISNQY